MVGVADLKRVEIICRVAGMDYIPSTQLYSFAGTGSKDMVFLSASELYGYPSVSGSICYGIGYLR
ncbi:MAG: hypothetical protein ACXABY_36510 [Candidatus Thorarchaeota archaeon]